MSYNSFGPNHQLINGAEWGRLKMSGVIKEGEYVYIEGDMVVAENPETRDRRIIGRAAELLVEGGSKRVLKG